MVLSADTLEPMVLVRARHGKLAPISLTSANVVSRASYLSLNEKLKVLYFILELYCWLNIKIYVVLTTRLTNAEVI